MCPFHKVGFPGGQLRRLSVFHAIEEFEWQKHPLIDVDPMAA
jgi:hypothetical protein